MPERKEITQAIDNILGSPYYDYGLGPDRFSCYGVYLHLLRYLNVRNFICTHSPETIALVLRDHRRADYEPIEPLDLFYKKAPKPEDLPHVWVVENDRYAVTAASMCGVYREEIHSVLAQNPRRYRLCLSD
jgi:hypothetical protein